MTADKQAKPQVPLKDSYIIQDVAALIQVRRTRYTTSRIRNWTHLPFRRFFTRVREMFISRRGLAEWADRNSHFVSDIRKTEHAALV